MAIYMPKAITAELTKRRVMLLIGCRNFGVVPHSLLQPFSSGWLLDFRQFAKKIPKKIDSDEARSPLESVKKLVACASQKLLQSTHPCGPE
jgi:hypothetical protein